MGVDVPDIMAYYNAALAHCACAPAPLSPPLSICGRNFANVCRSFLVNFFNRQWQSGRSSGRGMLRARQRL